MNFNLFDDHSRLDLLPLTHTRPIGNLRCGILTINQKWEYLLEGKTNYISESYIDQVFNKETVEANLYINASILPNQKFLKTIRDLDDNTCIVKDEIILAFKSHESLSNIDEITNYVSAKHTVEYNDNLEFIRAPWDIFHYNENEIIKDFEILTHNKESEPIPSYVTAIQPENIFVEKGAILNPCIINATNAKIYIGKDAEIMEGVMMRGTIAICEHAVVKMGAKVYSGTTIGNNCKVGGEIQNVVFHSNSNKGHDGYLGNAVIGEWCNLGADTNCSNLKNDYGKVSVWNEYKRNLVNTNLQFCGLIMADHAKCAINTQFNTGTVVGVSANIFGADFPPKFVPNFTWGGKAKLLTYKLEKAIDTANAMMGRRNKQLSEYEVIMFQNIFERTSNQRN